MKRTLFIILVASALLAADKVEIKLFWSKDCEYCHKIMSEFLPPLLKKYEGKVELRTYEITENIDNYRLLTKLETEYGVENNPIPVIFVGNYVLGGADKIERELPKILLSLVQGKENKPEHKDEIKREATIEEETVKKPVYGIYFYKVGCVHCDRVELHLKYLEREYPEFKLERLDIDKKENKILNEALCTRFNIPENKHLVAPSIFFDDTGLVENEINLNLVSSIVESKSKLGSRSPRELVSEQELEEADRRIKSRISRFSPLVVIGAGLIDGVNPCAFGTIAFFVIFLSAIGRKRKEVMLVGLSFATAVFITYFLIGLGFFNFLKAISIVKIIAKTIYILGGAAAIVFGILSFYDSFKARKGKFKDIVLQLPEPIKKRIHRIIIEQNESRRHRNYVIMAASTGFLVSLLELACTGQVYLPTIIYLLGEKLLRIKALFYLFLYNIMFIIPLLILFFLFFFGTSSGRINTFVTQSTPTFKLLTGILFFILGVFILRTAL